MVFEGILCNVLVLVLCYLLQVNVFFDLLLDYVLLVELSLLLVVSEYFDFDQLFMVWLECYFDDVIVDVVVDKFEILWCLCYVISDSVKQEGKIVVFDIFVLCLCMLVFCVEVLVLVEWDFVGVEVFDFGYWGDGGVYFNLVILLVQQLQFLLECIEVLCIVLYDLVVKCY